MFSVYDTPNPSEQRLELLCPIERPHLACLQAPHQVKVCCGLVHASDGAHNTVEFKPSSRVLLVKGAAGSLRGGRAGRRCESRPACTTQRAWACCACCQSRVEAEE